MGRTEDRPGLAQAKAMAEDAAQRLERIVDELRAGGAYVTRTYMGDDPDNPRVIHYCIEMIRSSDGAGILVRETLPRGKQHPFVTSISDNRERCILCGGPRRGH